MAIFYRMTRCNIRSNKNYGKYYACAAKMQEMGMDEIVRRIQESCSLTEGDVWAAVIALEKEVRKALQDGYKVNLDGLGSFSLGIKSAVVDRPSDFNAKQHVKGFTCRYLPCGHRTRSEDSTLVRPFTEGCKVARLPEGGLEG